MNMKADSNEQQPGALLIWAIIDWVKYAIQKAQIM